MKITRTQISAPLFGVAVLLAPVQLTAQDADWSGAFVGANVGIGMVESEIHDFDEFVAFGYSKTDGLAGVANVQAGYNWQSGNFVYGAVVSLGTINFDETFENAEFCSPSIHSTAIDAQASIRGRAGIVSGNTLFYGTAGVAAIETTESLSCADDDDFNVDDRYEALVVGLGVESMITDNLSVNAEYLSYIADNQGVPELGVGDDLSAFDIQADTVTVGLNYHFY
jgi:opacity protein-like surface antigen